MYVKNWYLLENFPFWDGAMIHRNLLSLDELRRVEEELLNTYGDSHLFDAGWLNDLFAFNFDEVCLLIGFRFVEAEVIRDDEDGEL